jgi:hypothetical protein
MNIGHHFFVRKINGVLQFLNVQQYEQRNTSTFNLIKQSDDKFNFKDFDWILIYTDDRPLEIKTYENCKVFSYSTTTKKYDKAIPDFIFDKWVEVGIDDFEKVRSEIQQSSGISPKYNKIGWIGSGEHISPRKALVDISKENQEKVDAKFLMWNRSNPNKLTSNDYLTLPELVEKYKYLIDVEGCGYSGRLKLLMSGRIVFIVERPFEEFFYRGLIPWHNYIPVKRDLSDLIENFNKIESDIGLQNEILRNGKLFAEKYLTRDSSLLQIKKIIDNL